MPPSKKRKVSSSSDSNSSDPVKTKNEKTISEFLEQIDAIESSSGANDEAAGELLVTQASCTLLVLKSIQRQVLEKLKQTNKQLEEKRHQAKKQTVLLQNLQYEKSYLASQVGTDLPTPHLDRICTVGAEQQNKGDLSIGQARNLVLCGSVKKSYEDPANHDMVMATLHKEINARGTLERDVNNAEKTLGETKKKALEKQSFLKDLPKKLDKMEQASLPLQKFFGQSSLATSSSGSTVHLIGTDRKKRLDLAQSLSAPLYTLFIQLQAHLDASPDDQMTLEISSSNKPSPTVRSDDEDDAEWFQSDSYALLLQVPLPDAPKKSIAIEFQYLPKLRVITASVTGDNKTLLVNLFPEDTGDFTWTAENVKLTNVEANLPGRPFHWCNYLAGVHLPAPAGSGQVPLHLSTKVVCHELTRRVRAQTTLSHILKALEARTPIPFHPLLEQEWKDDIKDCTARLVGWTETDGTAESSSSKYERRFLAIVKRQKATLNATVTFDPTQYPTQPPTWSLLKGEENWGEKHGMLSSLERGTTPLYDSALGQIQNFVNTEFSKLVKEDIEETYDWILAHQLGKIMQLWDQSQTGTGGGDSAAAGKGKFAGVAS